MSLLDEVAALARSTRIGPRCTVGLTLDRLDGGDRDDLVRLLADPLVPGSLLSKALLARGHGLKAQTIQRHRRRICDCEPLEAA